MDMHHVQVHTRRRVYVHGEGSYGCNYGYKVLLSLRLTSPRPPSKALNLTSSLFFLRFLVEGLGFLRLGADGLGLGCVGVCFL